MTALRPEPEQQCREVFHSLSTHRRTKLIGYQASEIGHEQTLMKANFTRQNNNKQIQRATCLEKEISKLA
jgi:hypothetical protein